ncbi:hypothetical protein [Ideonella sp. BN130291]|uniref:hypothetical protein n=1 Tax=Ideonella sp. BN130291 TaxID=3112940 RepID=UPI002E263B59|nr:hypothetical protein [Ideonella sp. BN130291]
MALSFSGRFKSAAAAFGALLGVLVLPASAQENARAIGAVVAPPELVAAYSCTTYAEAVWLPKVQARAMTMVRDAIDKRAALAQLLSQYDGVVERMCRDATAIFQLHRNEVLDAYARQLPGHTADVRPFMAYPGAMRWAGENAAFLATTVPLVQYHALVKAIAPALLDPPDTAPDPAALEEVNETSPGMRASWSACTSTAST